MATTEDYLDLLAEPTRPVAKPSRPLKADDYLDLLDRPAPAGEAPVTTAESPVAPSKPNRPFVPFTNHTRAVVDEGEPVPGSLLGDIGLTAKSVGTGVYSAAFDVFPKVLAEAIRGGKMDVDNANTAIDRFIDAQKKDLERWELPESEKNRRLFGIIKAKDVVAGLQNLGYSGALGVAGMVAGAGIATAMPVVGEAGGVGQIVGGILGAGLLTAPVAFRATKDQFLADCLDRAKQANPNLTNEEWLEMRDALESDAELYAFWEAAPETVGNMITAGIIKLPVGTYLKRIPDIKNGIARVLTKAGVRIGLDVPEELATETVTQYKQAGIEAKVGLREKAPTISEAFTEIAPQVLVTTIAGLGMGSAANRISEVKDERQFYAALSRRGVDPKSIKEMSAKLGFDYPALQLAFKEPEVVTEALNKNMPVSTMTEMKHSLTPRQILAVYNEGSNNGENPLAGRQAVEDLVSSTEYKEGQTLIRNTEIERLKKPRGDENAKGTGRKAEEGGTQPGILEGMAERLRVWYAKKRGMETGPGEEAEVAAAPMPAAGSQPAPAASAAIKPAKIPEPTTTLISKQSTKTKLYDIVEIIPLTEATWDKYVKPITSAAAYTFQTYQSEFPTHTHVALSSMPGYEERVVGIGSQKFLEEPYNRPEVKGLYKPIKSLMSKEATASSIEAVRQASQPTDLYIGTTPHIRFEGNPEQVLNKMVGRTARSARETPVVWQDASGQYLTFVEPKSMEGIRTAKVTASTYLGQEERIFFWDGKKWHSQGAPRLIADKNRKYNDSEMRGLARSFARKYPSAIIPVSEEAEAEGKVEREIATAVGGLPAGMGTEEKDIDTTLSTLDEKMGWYTRLIRYVKSIPLFQGNKRKMTEPVGKAVVNEWTPEERNRITVIEELFGGGGGWGLHQALSHFINCKLIRIHELDAERIKMLQFIHERGDQLIDYITASGAMKIIDGVWSQASRTGGIKSGGGLSGRLNNVINQNEWDKQPLTEDQRIGLKIVADLCVRGNMVKRSLDETLKNIEQTQTVPSMKAAQEFKNIQGGQIEYIQGNSYAPDADIMKGDNVLAIVDPPYVFTTGYERKGIVGTDIYEQTAALNERLIKSDNNIIYTDSAWWKISPKHPHGLSGPERQLWQEEQASKKAIKESEKTRALELLRKQIGMFSRFAVVQKLIGGHRYEILGLYNSFRPERAGARPEPEYKGATPEEVEAKRKEIEAKIPYKIGDSVLFRLSRTSDQNRKGRVDGIVVTIDGTIITNIRQKKSVSEVRSDMGGMVWLPPHEEAKAKGAETRARNKAELAEYSDAEQKDIRKDASTFDKLAMYRAQNEAVMQGGDPESIIAQDARTWAIEAIMPGQAMPTEEEIKSPVTRANALPALIAKMKQDYNAPELSKYIDEMQRLGYFNVRRHKQMTAEELADWQRGMAGPPRMPAEEAPPAEEGAMAKRRPVSEGQLEWGFAPERPPVGLPPIPPPAREPTETPPPAPAPQPPARAAAPAPELTAPPTPPTQLKPPTGEGADAPIENREAGAGAPLSEIEAKIAEVEPAVKAMAKKFAWDLPTYSEDEVYMRAMEAVTIAANKPGVLNFSEYARHAARNALSSMLRRTRYLEYREGRSLNAPIKGYDARNEETTIEFIDTVAPGIEVDVDRQIAMRDITTALKEIYGTLNKEEQVTYDDIFNGLRQVDVMELRGKSQAQVYRARHALQKKMRIKLEERGYSRKDIADTFNPPERDVDNPIAMAKANTLEYATDKWATIAGLPRLTGLRGRFGSVSQQAAQSRVDNWINKQRLPIDVVVLKKIEDAIDYGVSSQTYSMLINEKPRGYFHRKSGRFFVISDALQVPEEAVEVVMHEVVGHFGVEQVLGKEYWNQVLELSKEIPDAELQNIADLYSEQMPDKGLPNPLDSDKNKVYCALEYIASRAEQEPTLYQKLIEILRKALSLILPATYVNRTLGVDGIDRLLQTARDYVRTGEAAPPQVMKGIGPRHVTSAGAMSKVFKPEVSPLGFYSQVERVVENAPQEKMPANQWLAWITKQPGVKKEELEETVNVFISPEDKEVMTKADVLDGIRALNVQLKEMVLSEESTTGKPRKREGAPKFAKYQTPGGENYREVLLTIPTADTFFAWLEKTGKADPSKLIRFTPKWEALRKEYDDTVLKGRKETTLNMYHGSHWGAPNVVVHVRINDRTDADGKKVLFIEEVQSDWHQEGRAKGYAGQTEPIVEAVRNDADTFTVWKVSAGDESFGFFENERAANIVAEEIRRGLRIIPGQVPNAPFKTSWPMLAMKRMIRYAAENGYDRIAWTTGEMQVERYDLSKYIDEINWQYNPPFGARLESGYDIYAVKNGINVIGKHGLKESDLARIIGKDMAQKVIDAKKAKIKEGSVRVYGNFSGLDLKIGGEGMKGFYDTILPAEVNKYVKKWGVKTGETKITIPARPYRYMITEWIDGSYGILDDKNSSGEPVAKFDTREEAQEWIDRQGNKTVAVPSIDITPAMKESVMQGQPMFAKRKPAPGKKYTQVNPITRDEEGRIVYQTEVDRYSPDYIRESAIRATVEKIFDKENVRNLVAKAAAGGFDQFFKTGKENEVFGKLLMNRPEFWKMYRSGKQSDMLMVLAVINRYEQMGSEAGRELRFRQTNYDDLYEDLTVGTPEEIAEKKKRMAEKRQAIIGRMMLTSEVYKKWQDLTDKERAEAMKELQAGIAAASKALKKHGYNDWTHINFDALVDDGKFIQIINEIATARAKPGEMIYEYWRNSILSGMQTNIVNAFSNIAFGSWELFVQRPIEALVNMFVKSPSAPTFASLSRAYALLVPNMVKAWHAMHRAWQYEVGDYTKFEGKGTVSTPGTLGRIIRIPQRGLLAMDEFFKTLYVESLTADYATRFADMRGYVGSDKENFIYHALRDKEGPLRMQALEEARRLLFQTKAGSVGSQLISARNMKGPIGAVFKFIFPFVTTPANLIKIGFYKSPFGILRMGYEGIIRAAGAKEGRYVGEEAGGKLMTDIVEQAIAWSALGLLYALSAPPDPDDPEDVQRRPWITGSLTGSPSERRFRYHMAPPQSFRVGNKWFSYARIEPFATSLTFMIDTLDSFRDGKPMSARDSFKLLSMVRDKTYLQGFGDIIRGLEDPEEWVRFGSNFASSWMPNLFRQALRATDPELRDLRARSKGLEWFAEAGLVRGAQAALPIAAVQPMPRYDHWGNPISKDVWNELGDQPYSDVIWRMIMPLRAQNEKNVTNIDRMIWNYNRIQEKIEDQYFPGTPRPTITVAGRNVRLSDKQYETFLQLRGKMALAMARQMPWNFNTPNRMDIQRLERVFSKASTMARAVIIQQAIREHAARAAKK